MTRFRGCFANSLLAAVAIFAVLVSLEFAARGYLRFVAGEDTFRRYATIEQLSRRFGSERRIFSPHPYLRYYLTPNYVSGANRHNSLGYRGAEIQDKEADEFRVVCIGGSTTYTSKVADYRQSFPDLLEKHLKSMGYRTVNVINAGTPGWTTWESLVNFEFRVLDLDPDLIVVYHAINDVGPRIVWPPAAYRGDNTGAVRAYSMLDSRHSPWEHVALVRMLLIRLGKLQPVSGLDVLDRPAPTVYSREFDRQSWRGEYPSGFFRSVSVDSILRSNPPVYYRRNLENLVALARSRHVETVLATFAILPWREHVQHSSWDSEEYFHSIDEANDIVRLIAETTDAHLFDFAEAFPQDTQFFYKKQRQGRVYWDPSHVNEAGADLKGRQFAEFIADEVFSDDSVETSNSEGGR